MSDQEEDQLLPADADERPTIGQLIAGVKQPAYMPRAAAPDAIDTPAPDVRPPLDQSAIPDAIRPRPLRPEEIPTAGSNLPRLAQEQAKVATPTSPVDPATGSIKPQYRPGIGTRLLRGIGDFASGGVAGTIRGAVDPSASGYYGPGATNWRFGREEQARQGQLEGINTQIKTQEQLDAENQKQRESLLKQAYEGQLGEKATALGKAAEENAATRSQLEASQSERNAAQAELARTKAGQTPEPKTDVELTLAYQKALAAKDPKAAIYKGALAELAKQKAAGKDTTASDVSKSIQVAEYRGREHDRIDQQQEGERRNRYAELDKDKLHGFDEPWKAAQRQKVDQELDAEVQPETSRRG